MSPNSCKLCPILDEFDKFIGKWLKLKQTVKEANLVLRTQAGNAWATLSVRLGHGGPSQQIHQKKAQGVWNGPAQQRHCEKRARAKATQGSSEWPSHQSCHWHRWPSKVERKSHATMTWCTWNKGTTTRMATTVRTVEDKVKEVLMEDQFQSWLST